jgi:hypothetical protein
MHYPIVFRGCDRASSRNEQSSGLQFFIQTCMYDYTENGTEKQNRLCAPRSNVNQKSEPGKTLSSSDRAGVWHG